MKLVHFSAKRSRTLRYLQPRASTALHPEPQVANPSYRSSGRCFRCGRTATVARRARTSSRKRLLLGFCSGLVPLRSPQNPAGTSRRARRRGAMLPRRAVRVAFRTLTNHRPSLMLLRVDCKALWRCGLYAAEALASGSRFQDATSSKVIQHPRWVMGMFDGRGL
jgi:hypothetical protein